MSRRLVFLYPGEQSVRTEDHQLVLILGGSPIGMRPWLALRFHPNGAWFYLLNEKSSTLAFMRYNSATGSLRLVDEISTLPEGFVGTNFTSEIMVSPNGSFLYAANRLHDTIAIFSIERGGHPELIDEEWTRGDYPRSFNIDPTGRYMYVCNQRSDAVTTFKVLGNGHRLRFANRYTPVGSPAAIVFL